MCWTNTGNAELHDEELHNDGEVLCMRMGDRPEAQRFLFGNPELKQPDDLELQPGTGIFHAIEDHDDRRLGPPARRQGHRPDALRITGWTKPWPELPEVAHRLPALLGTGGVGACG